MNAEEIIEGLRSSDAQAWEEFHRQYWPQVLAVISRKFPDLAAPDLARDVVSETLIAITDQVRRGAEIDPGSLRAYIMKVAQRKALAALLKRRQSITGADYELIGERFNAYKNRKSSESVTEFEPICTRPDPEQALRISRKAERVRQAMAQLRESDRDILQRFYYAGETKEQIMEAYAISYDQFRLFKSRALTRLMAYLYGQYSAMNRETQTMYTRKELRELAGPSPH